MYPLVYVGDVIGPHVPKNSSVGTLTVFSSIIEKPLQGKCFRIGDKKSITLFDIRFPSQGLSDLDMDKNVTSESSPRGVLDNCTRSLESKQVLPRPILQIVKLNRTEIGELYETNKIFFKAIAYLERKQQIFFQVKKLPLRKPKASSGYPHRQKHVLKGLRCLILKCRACGRVSCMFGKRYLLNAGLANSVKATPLQYPTTGEISGFGSNFLEGTREYKFLVYAAACRDTRVRFLCSGIHRCLLRSFLCRVALRDPHGQQVPSCATIKRYPKGIDYRNSMPSVTCSKGSIRQGINMKLTRSTPLVLEIQGNGIERDPSFAIKLGYSRHVGLLLPFPSEENFGLTLRFET
ncbi:hypothetical protein IFM89_033440 [Coptis chinensis]|uniref:Uncharacterized protein n=1 Tax=Coptis chinensis TaxID=261450 RepID=A0A835HZI0_9MAGN|nr:hypothetical protein IFM89_033440 [Coptis chinensis]